MKNFTLIIILLTVMSSFSQNAPIDFESGGYGAEWTWTVFENDDNPPVEIIANPDMSGINTSSTVAKITARQTGQPWAGCESLHGSDIGTYSINASNSTIKIMVWKSVISDVGIKLVKPDGWSMGEIKVANTVVNAWEELTFDFTSQFQDGYDQIVVFPDFDLGGRTQDNIVYFDNITFSEQGGGGTGSEPEIAAPSPTQSAQNVISMFSDAYTDVAVDTWRTDWSDGILQDVLVDGNPTKKYTSLNFVGIETVGANLIDATEMTHFHLDMWTPDANDFKVKLVDFGADGAYGGGDDTEHEITYAAPATETWISYDIPLSDFSSLLNRDHIAQLIFVKGPLGTIYIDNVFFFTDVVGTDEVGSNNHFKLNNQPNPFSYSTTINYTIPTTEFTEISIHDLSGRKIKTLINSTVEAGTHQLDWNITNENSGVYFIKIQSGKYVDVKKCIVQ